MTRTISVQRRKRIGAPGRRRTPPRAARAEEPDFRSCRVPPGLCPSRDRQETQADPPPDARGQQAAAVHPSGLCGNPIRTAGAAKADQPPLSESNVASQHAWRCRGSSIANPGRQGTELTRNSGERESLRCSSVTLVAGSRQRTAPSLDRCVRACPGLRADQRADLLCLFGEICCRPDSTIGQPAETIQEPDIQRSFGGSGRLCAHGSCSRASRRHSDAGIRSSVW